MLQTLIAHTLAYASALNLGSGKLGPKVIDSESSPTRHFFGPGEGLLWAYFNRFSGA